MNVNTFKTNCKFLWTNRNPSCKPYHTSQWMAQECGGYRFRDVDLSLSIWAYSSQKIYIGCVGVWFMRGQDLIMRHEPNFSHEYNLYDSTSSILVERGDSPTVDIWWEWHSLPITFSWVQVGKRERHTCMILAGAIRSISIGMDFTWICEVGTHNL